MRKRVAKALQSWEEADEVLQEIGRLYRELGKIDRDMNQRIDGAKAQAKERSQPFSKEKNDLELELEQFCQSRYDEFKKIKSKRLTFGTVSFRLSSKLSTKKTWEWVLAQLKELGWRDCIRTKEEPDKEALKALGADRLSLVGCKLKVDDVFGYEVDQAKIQAASAA